MMCLPAGLGTVRPQTVFATQTLLSAVNKTADVILSSGDTQAESNSTTGGGVVLSVGGKTSGKFYFEVGVTQFYTVNNSMGVGLHRGIAGLATFLGGDVDGWGLWDRGTSSGSETYTNNVASNTSSSGDFDLGVRIRVAVDVSAGRIWFGQSNRNSGAWFGGGDPAAGTNPTYTFTPGGDTFYLALCPRRGDTSVATNRNRLQLILQANWNYAAPAGFGVWT